MDGVLGPALLRAVLADQGEAEVAGFEPAAGDVGQPGAQIAREGGDRPLARGRAVAPPPAGGGEEEGGEGERGEGRAPQDSSSGAPQPSRGREPGPSSTASKATLATASPSTTTVKVQAPGTSSWGKSNV